MVFKLLNITQYIMDINNIGKLIGNTPMIKISCIHNHVKKDIYTKLEWYNFTGSIKDRVAYHIIKSAKLRNELKDGQPIIEATSGNMGISIAAIGGALGHIVHIFMPSWMSNERKQILKSYGAILHDVTREEGGFVKAIYLADELSKELNGFRSNQFSNIDNIEAHYLTTAMEILDEMKGIKIDGFVSGIGTGGTLMGISKKLKEHNENIKIYAFEPDTLSVILNGVTKGEHKIAGIGDEFIPELVDKSKIDKIILINDNDAINMARILAKDLGLGVGISSGANFLASVLFNNGESNIVTIFPDDNKKYLSTDLKYPVDKNKDFISNQIELLKYEVL